MSKSREACMFGLIAEFEDSKSLKAAARKVHEAGYQDVSAYSPYHVEGLHEIISTKRTIAPYLVVVAIFVGAALGFWLQRHTSVFSYPFNIGGRPLNSWPAFMLITFEVGILFAALTAAGTMFLRIGLPLPYHPVFNAQGIEEASRSRFFICIETTDKQFHTERTWEFLESLEPLAVSEVPC